METYRTMIVCLSLLAGCVQQQPKQAIPLPLLSSEAVIPSATAFAGVCWFAPRPFTCEPTQLCIKEGAKYPETMIGLQYQDRCVDLPIHAVIDNITSPYALDSQSYVCYNNAGQPVCIIDAIVQ